MDDIYLLSWIVAVIVTACLWFRTSPITVIIAIAGLALATVVLFIMFLIMIWWSGYSRWTTGEWW